MRSSSINTPTTYCFPKPWDSVLFRSNEWYQNRYIFFRLLIKIKLSSTHVGQNVFIGDKHKVSESMSYPIEDVSLK